MKKSIHSNDCEIVYDVYNDDKAVSVILIHGYGINRKMWDNQISCFSEEKLIIPDVRGHGESRPCMDFTVPKSAQDIYKILETEKKNCGRKPYRTYLLP